MREQLGYTWGVMFQLAAVGNALCVGKKDCAAAEVYFLRAAVLALELGEPLEELKARIGLGRVAQSRNEGVQARKQFEAALVAARRAGDPQGEVQAAVALSEALAAAGHQAEALRVLEAVWKSLMLSGQREKAREVAEAFHRLRGS